MSSCSSEASEPAPDRRIFKTLYLDNQKELGGLPQHKTCRKCMSWAFANVSDTFLDDLEGAERIIRFFQGPLELSKCNRPSYQGATHALRFNLVESRAAKI